MQQERQKPTLYFYFSLKVSNLKEHIPIFKKTDKGITHFNRFRYV